MEHSINPLMPGGNKNVTFLLPPGIKGLTIIFYNEVDTQFTLILFEVFSKTAKY